MKQKKGNQRRLAGGWDYENLVFESFDLLPVSSHFEF